MTEGEKIQIIISTIDRHWSQAVQSENQRATTTNYLITFYGAAQAFIIQKNFAASTLLAEIVFIILSTYGVVVTFKYYERFRLHASRVGRLMEELTLLDASVDLAGIEAVADRRHKLEFPVLSKFRLHKVWLSIHYGFGLLAILNLIISLAKIFWPLGCLSVTFK
jgi:hypothetical protein